jgi:hypothetical protein
MTPNPEVESLWFTWDWKKFIEGFLTSPQMHNHSFYNGFRVSKDVNVTKLRLKRLPQDEDWLPPTGIQLIKPNIQFDPVGSSEFRVPSLNLDKVLHDLQKYFKRMPTPDRVSVSNSWDRLKEALEAMPRRIKTLPTMKLQDLPKMSALVQPSLPDQYDFVDNNREDLPEVVGKVCEEGLFDENIKPDLDVIVYTKSLVGRPWVGRVQEVVDSEHFIIQWFDRQGKTNKFRAMLQADKSPYTSLLENNTVMFWGISIERTVNSFHLTPYWLAKVMKEYLKCDAQRK